MSDLKSKLLSLGRKDKKEYKGYSITQRGNAFLLRVANPLDPGKPINKTLYSRHDANVLGAKLRADLVNAKLGGQVLEDHRAKRLGQYTVADMVNHYIEFWRDNEAYGMYKRHKTFFTHEVPMLNKLMKLQAWFFDKKLSSLRKDDFERQRDERLTTGIYPVTYLKEYTMVCHVLYEHARDLHPDKLPIPRFEFKKPKRGNNKRTKRVLKPGEFEKIEAAILTSNKLWANRQYRLMLHWLYETSVRPGAMCQVKWKDVNLTDREYWQIGDKDKADYYCTDRIIPLSPNMVSRIKVYYNMIPEEWRKPDQPVFRVPYCKRKGKPYKEATLSEQFQFFFHKAGITDLVLYNLRDTAINRNADLGMDPRDVQYLAGHRVGRERPNPTYYLGCIRRIRAIIDKDYDKRDEPKMPESYRKLPQSRFGQELFAIMQARTDKE